MTGTIVFQRLGVNVEQVLIDQQSGLQKLQSGEVAALVRVVGKPVEFFSRIPSNSGLHLVPIPFTKMFADYYTLGEFDAKDYPSLIEGQTVNTIAVPAVLAVFNWPKGSDRYRRVERFVERLFAKWDSFQVAPSQVARCEPGGDCSWLDPLERCRADVRAHAHWPRSFEPRFPIFLRARRDKYAAERGRSRRLFRQFLQWREQQRGRRP